MPPSHRPLIPPAPRLCASLMYGSGLRLSECTQLRVKDIDFDRGEIMVRVGKGDKDRRVPLPRLALPALKVQMERVRRQFERDLRSGVVGAALPGALERKLPNADRDWRWQYLFPASRIYAERETGKRRRHHIHESAIQRAVSEAVRASGMAKRATCHSGCPKPRGPSVRVVSKMAAADLCFPIPLLLSSLALGSFRALLSREALAR